MTSHSCSITGININCPTNSTNLQHTLVTADSRHDNTQNILEPQNLPWHHASVVISMRYTVQKGRVVYLQAFGNKEPPEEKQFPCAFPQASASPRVGDFANPTVATRARAPTPSGHRLGKGTLTPIAAAPFLPVLVPAM
eukprot:scaffold163315_cov14-Tisochrysis_lutea.AAC.1